MIITKQTTRKEIKAACPELQDACIDVLLNVPQFLQECQKNMAVIDRQYLSGKLGKHQGFDFYE